ncbi:4953_t:CDS:2 [Ambispora gerdemannii]|uniref:4953_t:CDS:1 n=1 Tax=Ambispora gerdemannii TaxID=144530 RepID=A0A9N9H0D9_9GLOM|nr:4953_t:CDS:2 [Ambispora gerdemannii]
MSSLAVSGIAPFLDFAGLLMFVEKFSIYLVIGATFYFSRTTKQDIDAKHNSDLSTRDSMFNEILANRNARLTTSLPIQRSKESLQCLILQLQDLMKSNKSFKTIITILVNLSDQQNDSNQNDGNQSEVSSGSSQRSFSDITLEIWNQFKIIFDRIMAEKECSFDDMCNVVMVTLRVGKIGKDSIKNYYRKINLDKIGAWIDSKTVIVSSGKELSFYGLGFEMFPPLKLATSFIL